MSERYELIAAEKADFEVTMMCGLLEVSRSGFYEWTDRPVSAAARRREELTAMITQVFERSGRTYGYRRVHAELARAGVPVDDELVRRLMRAEGLTPVQVRRRRGLTVADKAAGPIPDLVDRDFTAAEPGQKMVGDITQVDTGEGPLFLASVIDCFSKTVLGWSIDERYPAGLVCAALDMAGGRIPLPAAAVFHSDLGSTRRTSSRWLWINTGCGSSPENTGPVRPRRRVCLCCRGGPLADGQLRRSQHRCHTARLGVVARKAFTRTRRRPG